MQNHTAVELEGVPDSVEGEPVRGVNELLTVTLFGCLASELEVDWFAYDGYLFYLKWKFQICTNHDSFVVNVYFRCTL